MKILSFRVGEKAKILAKICEDFVDTLNNILNFKRLDCRFVQIYVSRLNQSLSLFNLRRNAGTCFLVTSILED